MAPPRVPRREALMQMSASRILRSMDFGSMMTIAYTLRRNEREAVAAYLGKADGEKAMELLRLARSLPLGAILPARPWYVHLWRSISGRANSRFDAD
jgi:hypothetical protein